MIKPYPLSNFSPISSMYSNKNIYKFKMYSKTKSFFKINFRSVMDNLLKSWTSLKPNFQSWKHTKFIKNSKTLKIYLSHALSGTTKYFKPKLKKCPSPKGQGVFLKKSKQYLKKIS